MKKIAILQLGKNGLTTDFISNLERVFNNRELVKISVLKSCETNKKEIKNIAEKICQELKKAEKKEFTFKIIGHTFFIRKWRKLKKVKLKEKSL